MTETSTRGKFQVDVPEGTHGAATVKRFTVGPHDLSNLRYSMRGRGTKPGEYTMLLVNQNLWMSDTDAEVRDHFEAIHQIRLRGGHILINGLGLGVVVKAALACDNVDLVTVVERDPDVIALVAPHYAVDPRFRIVQADAFTVQWYPKSHWTVAWHDIWLHLSLDNLPEMHRLHRKYGTRVDWQGSWSRNWIEHQRRTGRVLG